MSVSMSLRIEKQTGRAVRLSNFEDAYAEKKALDRAAKAAGVASLFAFVHSLGEEDEWAAEALGDPDIEEMSEKEEEAFDAKLEKMIPRVGKWYSAADGLKTVDALIEYRRSTGAPYASIDQILKDLRKALAAAVKAEKIPSCWRMTRRAPSNSS